MAYMHDIRCPCCTRKLMCKRTEQNESVSVSVVADPQNQSQYDNLLPSIGSEQQGTRPALIIQNDVGNEHSNTVIVAMITGKAKKPLPTHVTINNTECGLPENSVVMLEQIQTLDKQRLGTFIGCVSADVMNKIDKAALCSLGITSAASMFFRNEIHKKVFQKQTL